MRDQQVDLKLISGDARETVTAVAHAVGIPEDAQVIEGSRAAHGQGRARAGGAAQHDLLPDHARAEEGAGRRARRARPLHGDDRRRRQRRAGAEAGAARRRDGLGKPDHQGRRRHRPAARPVLDAAARGRRGPADRPQHPPARAPVPDQVGLRRLPDPARGDLRLHLPVPAPPAHRRRAADDRHPLVRARAGPERGPALPRAAAAGAGRIRVPRRDRHGHRLAALVLPRRQRLRRHASRRAAPRRRRR